MDIKLCKLVDGSFVIGKETIDGEIVEAIELMLQPSQNGMSIGIVPLLYPFNQNIKNEIVIPYSKVLICITPDNELVSKYIEATTGIVTAKSIITN